MHLMFDGTNDATTRFRLPHQMPKTSTIVRVAGAAKQRHLRHLTLLKRRRPVMLVHLLLSSQVLIGVWLHVQAAVDGVVSVGLGSPFRLELGRFQDLFEIFVVYLFVIRNFSIRSGGESISVIPIVRIVDRLLRRFSLIIIHINNRYFRTKLAILHLIDFLLHLFDFNIVQFFI